MPYKGKYIPGKPDAYALSRSKVEQFISCPRCFYLDRRLGIAQPPSFPFNLNNAVDALLKREFDGYRNLRQPHPYMRDAGLNAVPFQHPDLDIWRENFQGVQFLHRELNLHLYGAVDDLWVDLDSGAIIVADYKATSKTTPITLDADWQMSYKRQMEFYQYLLRKNGFSVADTGYFVYCNGIRDRVRFNAQLNFKVHLLPYTGNTEWVEPTLTALHALLNQDAVPGFTEGCGFCKYQEGVMGVGN
ncbi:PD-(D/E)XK nuclease family protein [Robiginitalea sp.]|nr:PD-(D/E)XK nuclease family protein [Robiginitalea sp.]